MSKKAFTYVTFLIAFVLLLNPHVLSASAFQSYTDGRYDESFRLSYSKALQGDPIASQIIGMILIEGKGSAKSDKAAGKRFLISSIDSGRAESARYLAELYEDGKVLEQNLGTALLYYRKAEELGASNLGGNILALAKKVEGKTSKAACRRYSKSDKKLATLIAQCIEKGFLDDNPARYWLVSFDNGEISSFVKAAKTLLKVESASFDPKKIVTRLPRFDEKASKKEKKRLERVVLENSFSSKGCKTGKGAMGFPVKGDVDGCVAESAGYLAEVYSYLAELYEDGKVLEQNLGTALLYYRKAEELGASNLGGNILALAKKVEGKTSKAACRRYSKSDKKLATLIAQCIEKGFLDDNPARYWLVSFDNGEISSFVKAAKTLLKVESASFDPKKIVTRLPRFDEKASKKEKKRLERVVLENGFSSKGCKTGKDAMGFEVKGDVDGCVLSAAAGDVKAISFAASWWRNGEFGLTRNKKYAESLSKKLDSLPKGDFVLLDLPQLLKGLESDPRRHFERAMEFYQKDPVVYGKVVGAALQFEVQLIIQDRIQEFANSSDDVVEVLFLADLNTLDPYAIAAILKKKNVDFKNVRKLSSAEAIANFNKIEFRKKWFVELIAMHQGTAKYLLTQYVDKSCTAVNFAIDNPSLLETVELNKSPLLTQCLTRGKGDKNGPSFTTDPVRAAAVLATKLNGPVGSQCKAFAEYLNNRAVFNDNFIGTLPAAVQSEEENLRECEVKNGEVALYSAKQAFVKGQTLKVGTLNSGKGRVAAFTKTYDLATIACDHQEGYGCGLAAFMIRSRPIKASNLPEITEDQNVENMKQAKARQLARQGWSLNSVEAGAYLLDLMRSAFASEGQVRDRKKLFKNLMKVGGPAVEIRKHAQCIEKDGALGDVVNAFGSLLGGGKNCSSDCVALRKILYTPDLDFMSKDRANKLLNRQACN